MVVSLIFGDCSSHHILGSSVFIFSFPEFQASSAISSEPPSKSSQDSELMLFFRLFYLVILLLPEFFTVVLHDLIHSSRVHQDFVGGVQVSFPLASRSAINSPFSFEVEFCICSFFSAIQPFPFVAGYHLMILRCYL